MEIGFLNTKFVLIFFRVLAILWLIPLLSSRTVSTVFKAGFALILSLAIFEHVPTAAKNYDSSPLLVAVFKEVFIGMSIGFVVRMAFSAVYAAGDVIALQTGLSFARFMDPSMMAQVSVIESFKNLLAIIVFFTVDAHHLLIRALSKSFDEIPLGVFFIKPPLFGFLVEIAGRIFALGLKIGAPVIFVLMLVEIILGLLARMVPQMNIFIEGLPLKILVSFVILSFSLSFAVPYIGSIFLGVERDVLRLMRLLS
jgi:flagellar biosynthetic protein FliR